MVCRTIVFHVAPESFEPGVCRALGTLGYNIVAAREEPTSAELQIVNEESLEQIGRVASLPAPILLLTRNPARRLRGPRVVDSLRRPVSFRDLYVSIQRLVEPTPRADPRASTTCPARCTYANEICFGTVISLSEGGCLFRSYREPPDESETQMLFALPPSRRIEVRARMVRREKNHLSLRFLDASSDIRSDIGSYVMDELLAN